MRPWVGQGVFASMPLASMRGQNDRSSIIQVRRRPLGISADGNRGGELSRDLRRLFGLSHAAKGTSFSLA